MQLLRHNIPIDPPGIAKKSELPMKSLRDRSMRQRITLVIELTTSAVLLLACLALFAFQAWSIRKHFVNQLTVMGGIVANNVAEAAKSRDEERAMQTLSGLVAMPQIVAWRLEMNDGWRLAHENVQSDSTDSALIPGSGGYRLYGTRVLFAQPVLFQGQREGTLYLQADFQEASLDLLRLYGGILALVLGVSLILAFVLSNSFQHFVTAPILSLAHTAQRIAHDKDFAVRAEKEGGEEVGVLTDAFNQMLAQIQSQDSALRESEERFRSVTESASDAIIIADGGGRLLSWNKGARLMFGYEVDEVRGQRLSSIMPDRYRTMIDTGFARFPENGTARFIGKTVELSGLRKDGGEFPFEMALSTWTNSSGTYFSGVIRDISGRKGAEEALRLSQQKLLESSRLAGMAEVATGVLHNVGNVLNSVNVSAGLVVEKLRRSKAPKLVQAAALLTERNGDLGDFLANDPAGQKLPGYLAKLGEHLTTENAEMLREVDQLGRNIEHIKEVVTMQQDYAKVGGLLEHLPAERLVEDAIAINMGGFERHGIKIKRDFSPAPPLRVDRHKVLQILINLIRNAKYALDDVERTDKQITLSIAASGRGTVCLSVADNGVGISKENLTCIFGHGFTTRRDGHGFGLHTGALAARDLGGSLTATSDGPGHGAIFTLELPIAPAISQ